MNMKKLHVYGSSYIEPAAKWCLDEILQSENYNIKIWTGPLHEFGTMGMFVRENRVMLSEEIKDRDTELRVLFHELRHWYQYKTNMFPLRMCQTLKTQCYTFEEYKLLPWELDASEFATKVVGKYLEKIEH